MKENRYEDYTQLVEQHQDQRVARAIKEAEEKADLYAKNRERLNQQMAARARKTRAKKVYEEQKEFHNQIGVAACDMLRQFINELAGMTLVPVGDLNDGRAVERRKSQLSIVKETLAAVQLLMKFQAQLAEEYNLKKDDAKDGQQGNVVLFKQAEKLLKQASK
jgi:hypothetical protein